MDVSEFELSKVIADALCLSFKKHSNNFPDFDTLGAEVAVTISKRLKDVNKNKEAYQEYFKIEKGAFNFSSKK